MSDPALIHKNYGALRKFFEAKDDNLEEALWFLQQIGLLYQIERAAREKQFGSAERLALRQQQAPK